MQSFKCQKILQTMCTPLLALFLCGVSMIKTVSVNILKYFPSFSEGRVLLELTHRCAGEGEKVSWVPTGTVSSSQSGVPVGNCQCSGSEAAGSVRYYRRQEKVQKKIP
jgi:hypothetical protein